MKKWWFWTASGSPLGFARGMGFLLFAGIVVAFGSGEPVRADNVLCNRFMTFVARARGDATAEFNRRIAFLFETGKIGFSELDQMASSEVPLSPFGAGQHWAADVVPHGRAVAELVVGADLDWEVVRRFVRELRMGVERGRQERAVQEEQTKAVVYPRLRFSIRVAASSFSPPVFEEGGKRYVVAGSGDLQIAEALTGKVVGRIATRFPVQSGPEIFKHDGKAYLAAGLLGDSHVYVWEAFTGQKVAEIRMDSHAVSSPTVFKRNGVAYVVVASKDGFVYLNEALTGREIQKMAIAVKPGGNVPLSLFERDGNTYVVVKNVWGIHVRDVMTGREAVRIEEGGVASTQAAVFEGDGRVCVAFGSCPGCLIVSEALTGGEVTRILTVGSLTDPPAVFEQEGRTYLAAGTAAGVVHVNEAFTGADVARIKTGKSVVGTPIVFKQKGRAFLAILSTGGRVDVADAMGGEVLVTFSRNGTPDSTALTVFQANGTAYLLDRSWDGAARVYEALTGKDVATVNMAGLISASPTLFTENGELFAAVASLIDLHVVDLVIRPTEGTNRK